ncbi:MAG TPA: heme ABC transporter permease [Rhizobiales bacterium]|nr:heme ABC transporter permease [Hyphomicrobiales bacterium]
MARIEKFANPTRFLRLQETVQPWLAAITVALFAVGLYFALISSPADYQQGETVRIMFVHVPAAWGATMVYAFMALSSAIGIIFRHPLADLSAKAAAPIGAVFTFLALVTGALWGKPMWGAYWVWDARLTSFFVLFLLYLGYMAVWQAIDDYHRAAKVAAVVALVGAINVPIIKFSVEWWNSLHQPSIFSTKGSSVDSSILTPLLIMVAAYSFLFLTLHLLAIRTELRKRKIQQLQLAQAQKV